METQDLINHMTQGTSVNNVKTEDNEVLLAYAVGNAVIGHIYEVNGPGAPAMGFPDEGVGPLPDDLEPCSGLAQRG